MKIAEHKNTEALLLESLQRLKEAAKIARNGHIDLDLTTGEVIWSDETFRIHACDPEKFEPTFENTISFLHPDDASFVQEVLELAMSGKKKYALQHRIINCKGEIVHVSVNGDLTYNASGEPIRMLVKITDVTELTKAKQREELRTKVLEQLAKDIPLDTLLETMVLGAEQYSPGTLCSILLTDKEGKHLHNGASPSLPDYYNEAIDGVEVRFGVGSCGTAACTGERVIVEDVQNHPYWEPFKDLTKKAGLASCWSEPIKDGTGKVLGTFAIYNTTPSAPNHKDIELIGQLANLAAIVLERFYASATLKESEEKYRELVEQASDGIFIFDATGHFLEINSSGSSLVGYKKEEIRGLHIKDIIHEEDLLARPLKLKELAEGNHLLFERRIKRKDGFLFEAEISTKMLSSGTGHAIMRDITQRKQAEEALRESECKLALTLDSATDFMGLVDINEKGEFIFRLANKANRDFIKFLGIDINNYYGAELKKYSITYLGFTKEDALAIEKIYKQVVRERRAVTVQNNFQDPYGDMFYNETTVNPVFDENGSVKQVLYVTRDITEVRKVELALKENEKKLALTLDSTIDMMGLMNLNEKDEFVFNTANRATRESIKQMQIDEKDYFGAELKSYCTTFLGFTKEEALKLEETYRKVIKDKKPVKVFSNHSDLEGNLFYIETTINPVFENDTVKQVLWVNKDVTEAKNVEEQLKISEQQLNEAQKIAKLGSWEFYFSTKKAHWSKAQYHLFEQVDTPQHKLYTAFKDKIHPDDLPKFDNLDKRAMETGKGYTFEYRIVCNDGRIKNILAIGEPIRDHKGKIIGLKGTDQDITDKVKEQKRILKSMIAGEEKERKRLAAELHDSLGQTLSLISLNLDSVLNVKEGNSLLARQKLEASLEMVNQTIDEIRSISHDLMPSALENYGLQSVLENMFKRFRMASDTAIDLYYGKDIDRFDPNIEINIYRIVQEALNNTLKHADAGQIALKIFKEGEFLRIFYKDDGKGFDPSISKKASTGLKNIRNRVYLLGGTLDFRSKPKKGTRIKIKIPL